MKFSWFIFVTVITYTSALELFSIGAGIFAIGSAIYNQDFIKTYSYCKLYECCSSDYIKNDLPDLSTLIGQHIAEQIIPNALKYNLYSSTSGKPLVISFLGTPGVGKNYISNLILKKRYKLGEKSSFVHTYIGRVSFPLTSKVEEYKLQIVEKVISELKKCPSQTFIFDEVDKMPEGVFDLLTPLLDNYVNYESVDFTKALFLFLGNEGGVQIGNHLAKLIWDSGVKREHTRLHDFESIVEDAVFKGIGAFRNSQTVLKGVVDYYIPFLPLEQRHVEECIIRYLDGNKDPDLIREVMKYVVFEDATQLFASTGCKRLEGKAKAVLHDHNRKTTLRN